MEEFALYKGEVEEAAELNLLFSSRLVHSVCVCYMLALTFQHGSSYVGSGIRTNHSFDSSTPKNVAI